MPAISAIVTTYNRSAYLIEAIESLQAQTRPVQQIVIWDDGSTDGTMDVAKDIARRSGGQVAYHRSDNRGKAHALNAAISQSSGDILWICDDDDVVLPDAALRLEEALNGSGVALAAGKHDRFRDTARSGERVFLGPGYWPDLSQGSILRHILEDIFFFQNATLVKRDALQRAGPFRENLARSIDYEMFVRLASRNPVRVIDRTVFHQRKHDGARGPAANRHAAAASDSVWRAADKAIFDQFRSSLPLSLYEAMFAADDPALLRRVALLQRACVYARRTDWAAAITDLNAAARIREPGALREVERDILKRTMSGKHGSAEAFRKPAAAQVSSLDRQGHVGAAIKRHLARASRWRIREAMQRKDLAMATRAVAFFCGNGGLSRPSDTHAGGSQNVSERRDLAPDAYDW